MLFFIASSCASFPPDCIMFSISREEAYLFRSGTMVSAENGIAKFSIDSFSSSKQETLIDCLAISQGDRGFFSFKQKVLSIPFLRVLGKSGQVAFSKIFSSKSTLKLDIEGEVMACRRYMICFFISLLFVMKRCSPPPSFAPLLIMSKLTPFPIPTACVQAIFLVFIFDMMFMTSSGFETCPSVSKIICLLYSFISFSTSAIDLRGRAISVPPRSAPNAQICLIASSICSSQVGMLALNILLNCEPKLITLKIEHSGSDFKKRISDSLALSMRSPPIEPDLSTRKMYSPLYWSQMILVERGVQKVSPTHLFPIVHTGVLKFACSKVNSRSFSGTLSSFKEYLLQNSFKMSSLSKCEEELAPTIFLVPLRLIWKSHSVLASAKLSTDSGYESTSFLNKVLTQSVRVWYLGLMCEGILRVHLFCISLESFPTISNSILTSSEGCRFPSLTFSTDFSFSEGRAIITVFPYSFAALYSAFTFSFSLITPSTVTSQYTATTLVRQKLGSVGMEQ